MTNQEAIKTLYEYRHCLWDKLYEPICMAIKALEQEPSGDLISREATLTAFADYVGSGMSMDDYDALWNIVTKMPPVNLQEPRWIPVTERLPEKNIWVLVTVEQSGNCYQEIMRRNKYIEAWTDDIDNYTDEITAWMPLPEPYKAESEVL